MQTSPEKPAPKKDKDDTWLWFAAATAFVAVVALWVGIAYFAYTRFPGDDWQSRGQFGDMFGAVNALFSGLALCGVIIAILLQRKELQLQRQELEDTRKELKRSAEAQVRSAELAKEHLAVAQKGLEEQRTRHEETLRPRFTVETSNWQAAQFRTGYYHYTCKIKNAGREIFDVGVICAEPTEAAIDTRYWERGHSAEVTLSIPFDLQMPLRFDLLFAYVDGGRGRQRFVIRTMMDHVRIDGLPGRES